MKEEGGERVSKEEGRKGESWRGGRHNEGKGRRTMDAREIRGMRKRKRRVGEKKEE